MIERLIPHAHVARRPMTFAYTRPLSPLDLSGITGLLSDEAPAAPARAHGMVSMFSAFRGWFRH